MNKGTKERIDAFIRTLFHIAIPIVVVIMILNIWKAGVSNDAEMEWNIFVTVASLGGALVVLAIAFYVEWIADKYYWSKFPRKPLD